MVEYHQISIYTNSEELKDQIEEYAKKKGKSVSAITRRLWRKELEDDNQ